MEMPHYAINDSFNPWAQTFRIKTPDGTTSFLMTVHDISAVQQSAVLQSACAGVQAGAGLILLVVLSLVTKNDKRRSMVFLLNSLALVFVVLRGIISLAVFNGPFYDFYRWALMYYEGIGNAKAVSAAGEMMTFFLILMIELSLVLQVRIVLCNLSSIRRGIINVFNAFVAFVSIAVRFALAVLNINWNIAHVETQTQSQFTTLSELASAANITLVISIGISALIFCAKLGFAIEARRSMGMKQFGPMQIIFVMGCQTMFTPLIFTIITYFGVQNAQVAGFVPTIVAISLPVSAMWATVNTNNHHIATPDSRGDRAIPVGVSDFASAKAFGSSKSGFGSTVNTADTLVDDDSAAGLTPKKKSRFSDDAAEVAVGDLEMQRVSEGGVQVNRTYSVRSD